MILAGDIGGTKVVLGLFETGVGSLEKIREQTYASNGLPSLQAMCVDFLRQGPKVAVRTACFGVPGAVVDGACKTTNLPWLLTETSLAQTFDVPRVRLLNDLQAAGYGMLHLAPEELATLNPGRIAKHGNRGVIAAGTGLGEGLLAWTGDRHVPVASEGGHATFAPANELEDDLRSFIARRLGKDGVPAAHVSWERLLSGPGLGNVYDFLKARGVHEESPHVTAKLARRADLGSVVGIEAVNGSDRLCGAAADMFAGLYGARAGDVALQFLATGGMFIGGGVAAKMLPVLQRGAFMKAFLAKGRFEEFMRNIPVHVALNEKAPLLGAAHFAADSL